ncbi:LysR family transcriptional regulator [Maricurvus nonylphenolicus]
MRTSDGMQPTPVADNVIVDVRAGLDCFNRSVGKNVEFDPATAQKEFRLGMNDLAQSLVLPRLRREVREQAPKIAISTYYVDRKTAAEDLKSGSLDLLIDAPDIHAKDLDQQPLMQLPYVVAMRSDHPLATGSLSLEDYLGADHIHVSSRRHGRGQADVALRVMGKTRDIMMRVQNYLVAAAITEQSDLLWTVPRMMAEKADLHIVDPPFVIDPLVWSLYWSKSASDDPSFQWLRALIGDQIS